MLCADDARLVARDPLVPGLACVLDPDALAERLRAAAPRAGIEAARPVYVRYKPGTSCLVGLRVRHRDGQLDAYVKAHRAGDRGKAEKAVTAAVSSGPNGGGTVQLDDVVVVSFFPSDRRLRVGVVWSDPLRRRSLLGRLLPDRPDVWDGSLRRLAYKPERRYVARVDGADGPAAVLRWYADGDVRAPKAAARAFVSRPDVRVPRLLGASRRHRVLAVEWIAASAADPALTDPRCPLDAFEAAGRALAALHTQTPDRAPAPDPTSGAASLGRAVQSVAELAPDLAARARGVASRLAADLSDPDVDGRPLHGDFSADQVVREPAGLAIVDLDTATVGAPASDLGRFCAALLLDVVAGRLAPDLAGARRQALLRGYAAAAPRLMPVEARVDVHTGAWLLRGAVEPFRYRSAAWLDEMAWLLDAAASRVRA